MFRPQFASISIIESEVFTMGPTVIIRFPHMVPDEDCLRLLNEKIGHLDWTDTTQAVKDALKLCADEHFGIAVIGSPDEQIANGLAHRFIRLFQAARPS